MTLQERIERLRAHLRKKPEDTQARERFRRLCWRKAGARPSATVVSLNAMLKELYPVDLVQELRLRPHPLLTLVRR